MKGWIGSLTLGFGGFGFGLGTTRPGPVGCGGFGLGCVIGGFVTGIGIGTGSFFCSGTVLGGAIGSGVGTIGFPTYIVTELVRSDATCWKVVENCASSVQDDAWMIEGPPGRHDHSSGFWFSTR